MDTCEPEPRVPARVTADKNNFVPETAGASTGAPEVEEDSGKHAVCLAPSPPAVIDLEDGTSQALATATETVI